MKSCAEAQCMKQIKARLHLELAAPCGPSLSSSQGRRVLSIFSALEGTAGKLKPPGFYVTSVWEYLWFLTGFRLSLIWESPDGKSGGEDPPAEEGGAAGTSQVELGGAAEPHAVQGRPRQRATCPHHQCQSRGSCSRLRGNPLGGGLSAWHVNEVRVHGMHVWACVRVCPCGLRPGVQSRSAALLARGEGAGPRYLEEA